MKVKIPAPLEFFSPRPWKWRNATRAAGEKSPLAIVRPRQGTGCATLEGVPGCDLRV